MLNSRHYSPHPIERLKESIIQQVPLPVIRIFELQNSVLVTGSTNFGQPLCPCQNHPFTKMYVLYFASTISGAPGSSFTFMRYR